MDKCSCIHLKTFPESTRILNLSFSSRLLCLAVPFNWDQQIRLINLLAKRRLDLKQKHKAYIALAALRAAKPKSS